MAGVQSQIESYQRLKQNKLFDAALLDTQHYKVRIKGKVKQSKEKSSTPLHFGVVVKEKETFGSPPITVPNFTKCY